MFLFHSKKHTGMQVSKNQIIEIREITLTCFNLLKKQGMGKLWHFIMATLLDMPPNRSWQSLRQTPRIRITAPQKWTWKRKIWSLQCAIFFNSSPIPRVNPKSWAWSTEPFIIWVHQLPSHVYPVFILSNSLQPPGGILPFLCHPDHERHVLLPQPGMDGILLFPKAVWQIPSLLLESFLWNPSDWASFVNFFSTENVPL